MIPLFQVNMSPNASDAVRVVLESGWIGEGEKVEEFRHKLSELWENENVVCTNSCTAALEIVLRLFNVGFEDEVITSSWTFPATTCAIRAVGARPVLSQSDSFTGSTDADHAIRQITDKTKAVIVVLVGGVVPSNLDKLVRVLARKGIPLIFDAAHALTTTYKGQHISHWADASCFSFQSIKHLTTGDGGAIALKNKHLLEYAQRMTWFGMLRGENQEKVKIEDWGYKAHMNDISAAIGLANWDRAMWAVKQSRDNAQWFHENLPARHKIKVPEGCDPSWWVYLMLPSHDLFERHMKEKGIQVSRLWAHNSQHQYTFYNKISVGYTCFTAIPNGFWVDPEQRKYILDTIQELEEKQYEHLS